MSLSVSLIDFNLLSPTVSHVGVGGVIFVVSSRFGSIGFDYSSFTNVNSEVEKPTTTEPLFRGQPQDQGNCSLSGGWAGVC